MELEDTVEEVDLPTAPGAAGALDSLLDAATLADFQRDAERAFIEHQLDRHGWNVAATARAIDTPRSNLYKKIQAYDLKREDG